jgi:hypothetical protein
LLDTAYERMLFFVDDMTFLSCKFVIFLITCSQTAICIRQGSENKTMRWPKPNLKRSIYGLLGNPVAPSESILENGTEDIREAMLVVLGESGSKQFPQITRRIRYASDIQALWYLRGDLMGALAAMHGEMAAREKVAAVTRQFHGLLPNGLNSRSSPLVS